MSNTIILNAMWCQTICPTCGHTYQWHREGRNRCTECQADYGYLVTIAEINEGFDRTIKKLQELL